MTYVLYAQVDGAGSLYRLVLTTDDKDWLDVNLADMISAGVKTRWEAWPKKRR